MDKNVKQNAIMSEKEFRAYSRSCEKLWELHNNMSEDDRKRQEFDILKNHGSLLASMDTAMTYKPDSLGELQRIEQNATKSIGGAYSSTYGTEARDYVTGRNAEIYKKLGIDNDLPGEIREFVEKSKTEKMANFAKAIQELSVIYEAKKIKENNDVAINEIKCKIDKLYKAYCAVRSWFSDAHEDDEIDAIIASL